VKRASPSVLAGAALLVLLAAIPARALTCTAVSTTSVAFGAYDGRAGGPVDGQGGVDVTCDASVAFDIALNPGLHSSTFAPRRMGHATKSYLLDYNLFLDPARTQVWGDGTNATFTQSGHGNGAAQNYTIYGRIPGLQTGVGVGDYSDSVTVTVTY
jgi:spore coat protein U-like protein